MQSIAHLSTSTSRHANHGSSLKCAARQQQTGLGLLWDRRRAFKPARVGWRKHAPRVPRASQETKEKEDVVEDKLKKADAKTEELIKGMKEGGVDRATAQKILKVWESSGVKDPDQLRKLLLKRSLTSAGVVGIQTLLDAGAAYGAFSWATYLSLSPDDFFGKIAVQALAYFLAGYFAIGILMDFFMLGVISFAAFQYGTNSGSFMAAIREVAGQPSGVNILDKAQAAVNTFKVISALNDISDLLKKGVNDTTSSTLKNLSAMLTLRRAEEKGFDPAAYGLTAKEAGEVATVFSRFDENDDMVLQENEVKRLFVEEGYELDEAEVRAAMKLLDTDGDGLINFPEFVNWWVNKIKA